MLIASLFVHEMAVLPNIPADWIKKLEGDLVNYIWNGKKAKILLKTLKLPLEWGGLGLVDLWTKQVLTKATWCQILLQDVKFASVVFSLFSPILKINIFRCNIHPKDMGHIVSKRLLPFWHDMLEAWATFYYDASESDEQPIWYNSLYRIENHIFLWEKNFSEGLLTPKQLKTPTGWITEAQAFDSFKLSWMDYYRLIQIIRRAKYQDSKSKIEKNMKWLSIKKTCTLRVFHDTNEKNCEY